MPSLRVDQLQSSANTNFIIRGFGNGANNAGIEPSVGVFIDGVYRSRSAAQIADLPNVQRVEVLRGPQSTLFGKNASAGIISIVTAEPQFDFGGSGRGELRQLQRDRAEGRRHRPDQRDGRVQPGGQLQQARRLCALRRTSTRGRNNRNRYGVRGQLLFEPSVDFKFRLIGDYDKIDENCCAVANVVDGPTGDAVRVRSAGRVNSNQPFSYDSYANFPSINEDQELRRLLPERLRPDRPARADHDHLLSRASRRFTNQDSDFTSADAIGSNRGPTKIKTYTQELRLASDFDGPLNFLLGGFYFKEDIQTDGSLTSAASSSPMPTC